MFADTGEFSGIGVDHFDRAKQIAWFKDPAGNTLSVVQAS
jgi:hypothetical protein